VIESRVNYWRHSPFCSVPAKQLVPKVAGRIPGSVASSNTQHPQLQPTRNFILKKFKFDFTDADYRKPMWRVLAKLVIACQE
jgi:hypothetical protein